MKDKAESFMMMQLGIYRQGNEGGVFVAWNGRADSLKLSEKGEGRG
jgi:hypothetical protein